MDNKKTQADFDELFGPLSSPGKDNQDDGLVGLFGKLKPVARDDLADLFGALEHSAGADSMFGDLIDVSDPRKTDLAADWNNIDEVGRAGLIKALARLDEPNRSRLLALLQLRMQAVATAVGRSSTDTFFTQRGPTCQTMALLNGMVAVGDAELRRTLVSRGVSQFAGQIYQALPDRPGAVGGAKSPMDAVEYLQKNGFGQVRLIACPSNPVQLVRILYEGHYFLVYSTGANHVISWIPAPIPRADALVCRLDSLRDAAEPYDAQRFVQEWLRIPPGQQDVILVRV